MSDKSWEEQCEERRDLLRGELRVAWGALTKNVDIDAAEFNKAIDWMTRVFWSTQPRFMSRYGAHLIALDAARSLMLGLTLERPPKTGEADLALRLADAAERVVATFELRGEPGEKADGEALPTVLSRIEARLTELEAHRPSNSWRVWIDDEVYTYPIGKGRTVLDPLMWRYGLDWAAKRKCTDVIDAWGHRRGCTGALLDKLGDGARVKTQLRERADQ